MKEGDLIQITNKANAWYPCVLIVSDVKSFGVQAYITVPLKGEAYIRLNGEDYEKVGSAVVVAT